MTDHDIADPELDPTVTDGEHYTLIFENDRVRVLEYQDLPGDRTNPHRHPDSVMVTFSSFHRTISSGGRTVDVVLAAEQARWLDAQEHSGENIGSTPTHTIFVELKEPAPSAAARPPVLGPSTG